MTPRQVEQLLGWTNAGGHLLLVAEALWDEETSKSGDLLLDRLDIHQALSETFDEPAPARKACGRLDQALCRQRNRPGVFQF